MLRSITLLEKINSLEAEKIIGRFFYGKQMPFCKFTDSSNYIFYHFPTMTDFSGECNRYISFGCISHTINGVKSVLHIYIPFSAKLSIVSHI